MAGTLGGRGLALTEHREIVPQAVISQPGVLVVHTLLVGGCGLSCNNSLIYL